MHVYTRLSTSNAGGAVVVNGNSNSNNSSTPSPPSSPLRGSPRYGRSKSRSKSRSLPQPRTLTERLAWIVLSVVLRRQGVFLFAPLIYISGMLLYMGTVSLDNGGAAAGVASKSRSSPPPPGSLYRSSQLYLKLKPEMDSDNSSGDAVSKKAKAQKRGPDKDVGKRHNND